MSTSLIVCTLAGSSSADSPQPDRAPGLRHACSRLRHGHVVLDDFIFVIVLRDLLSKFAQAPHPAVLGDEEVTRSFLPRLSWTSFCGSSCPGSFVRLHGILSCIAVVITHENLDDFWSGGTRTSRRSRVAASWSGCVWGDRLAIFDKNGAVLVELLMGDFGYLSLDGGRVLRKAQHLFFGRGDLQGTSTGCEDQIGEDIGGDCACWERDGSGTCEWGRCGGSLNCKTSAKRSFHTEKCEAHVMRKHFAKV